MNYTQLQSRLLTRLSMDSTDPAAADAGALINEGLHELETAVGNGWPWMRVRYETVLSTSADAYTFEDLTGNPSIDISKILDISVLYQSSYWQKLDFVSPTEAEQQYPLDFTGPPEAWYGEGSQVWMYPQPTAGSTVRVRALTVEPDLSATTDTPVMPTWYHGAIVEAACAIFYETLQDTAKLQATQARVDRWVDRMKRYGPQTQTAPRVAVREPLW